MKKSILSGLFRKSINPDSAVSISRLSQNGVDLLTINNAYEGTGEKTLYDNLRYAVPVIDAAISKIIRLTGGFRVLCEDQRFQQELDSFVSGVPVGISGQSLHSFINGYLDSLLTYGNAVGEILVDRETMQVCGLANGDVSRIEIKAGDEPYHREYFYVKDSGERFKLENPQLILFSALNPPAGSPYGISVLRGLPCISAVLMRIYQCIGQNFDRVGNVRYAVTYKPSDSADKAFAKERAALIAKEWSDGINASRGGEVRDFVAVGDVDIKVIGADNQIIDTQIPVRQLLEQIVAKLSVPPFLLGLSWSSTERMSSQQADILTSELEFYRRLLNPVIKQICTAFLSLAGCSSSVSVEWDNINLQDEVELARARLLNAQAAAVEQQLNNNNNNNQA